ncbi:tetratricopeptide repeat protein [Microcoleus sp. A006_D1]
MLQLAPNYTHAGNCRGLAFGHLKQSPDSIESCDRAIIAINPNHASSWVNRGNILAKLGRQKECLEVTETAVEINSKFSQAGNKRALAMRRLGRVKQAIASDEKSLVCDSKNYESWDNRGDALAKMGKYKEAHKSIDISLEVKPDYANGIYNKGYCYACEGKTTLGVDWIAGAIELNRTK